MKGQPYFLTEAWYVHDNVDRSTCVNKNIDRPSVHTGITCHIAWTCVTSNLHTFSSWKGFWKIRTFRLRKQTSNGFCTCTGGMLWKHTFCHPHHPHIYSTRKFQGYEERDRLACTSCATNTRAPLKKSLPSCALSRDNNWSALALSLRWRRLSE